MKSALKLLFFVLFVSFLAVPGPVSAEKSVEKFAKKIKVNVDDFDGQVVLESTKIKTFKYDPYYISTHLVPKSGNVFHLIYVDYDFTASNDSGRRRYSSAGGSSNEYRDWAYARDPGDENRFDIRGAGRSFGGCDKSFCYYNEPYVIVIPDAYLRSMADQGFKLRAVSKAGIYMDIKIPANYLKAIVLRLDQEKAARGID